MSWGLPPKYKAVHQFRDASVDVINHTVLKALANTDFIAVKVSNYHVQATKKMRLTFLSFFSFSKPAISLVILIKKTGELTIKSSYNYNSMFGIAMNDAGKQKKEISILLEELKDLLNRNIEFARNGTVDGRNLSKSTRINYM